MTLHVVKAEVVESSKYKEKDGSWVEDVKFTAANGDTLFIRRATADQKLARIGFGSKNPDGRTFDIAYGDVDGSTLRFYRDHNPNDATKPYYGIDRIVSEGQARQASESQTGARVNPKAKAALSAGPNIPGLDTDPDDPGPQEYPEEWDDSMVGEPVTEASRGIPTQGQSGNTPTAAQRAVKSAEADLAALKEKAAKREAVIDRYRAAVAAAWDVWGPEAKPEVVQSGAATIFIALDRQGL